MFCISYRTGGERSEGCIRLSYKRGFGGVRLGKPAERHGSTPPVPCFAMDIHLHSLCEHSLTLFYACGHLGFLSVHHFIDESHGLFYVLDARLEVVLQIQRDRQY